MIKIDVDERKWKDIKKGYSKWYKKNILPNIENACEFLETYVKDNKGSSVERYLNLLKKIKEKGKNFVIEKIENRKEEEVYKILFDKNLVENLIKDLEKDFEKNSEWYKNNILPDINEACKELSEKGEKRYLGILEEEKIKFNSKKKLMGKRLEEELKKMGLPKKYLPQNLLFYKDYLPDKLLDYEKLSKGRKDLDERGKKLDKEEKKLNERIKELDKKRKKPDKEKKELDKKRKKLNEKRKKLDKDEEKKWSRHKLLFLMGIEVCPYCQRNYISNYEENNGKKTTADLDHFYPKSDYPFLALSLYNFIPSCQICNSRFKGNKDVCDSIYPYEEGFDELGVKFKTSKEAIYEILGEKDSDFSVKIDYENLEDEENKKKVENSIGNLGLDSVYKKSHNQYIQDLLYTIEKYPENYLEACVEMFENDNDKKKQLEEYFKDIVKEPYRKRIENGEPLAKLTKDILEEFNIKI